MSKWQTFNKTGHHTVSFVPCRIKQLRTKQKRSQWPNLPFILSYRAAIIRTTKTNMFNDHWECPVLKCLSSTVGKDGFHWLYFVHGSCGATKPPSNTLTMPLTSLSIVRLTIKLCYWTCNHSNCHIKILHSTLIYTEVNNLQPEYFQQMQNTTLEIPPKRNQSSKCNRKQQKWSQIYTLWPVLFSLYLC